MFSDKRISGICKYLFILLMFALPLSLEKEFLNSGTKLLWITEPICALINVLLAIYIIRNRKAEFTLSKIDKLALVFISTIIVSTFLSDDYFVSMKFSISLIWYFCGGYLVVRMFKFTKFQTRLSVIAYLSGIFVLSIYILNNFRKLGIFYESSYLVSAPFIKEGHTDMSVVIEPALIFAVILCLILPLIKNGRNNIIRLFTLLTVFSAVIMFSCSKASYAAIFICFLFFGAILIVKNFKNALILVYIIIPFLILFGIWRWNDYNHKIAVSELQNSYYTSGSDHYDPNDRTTYKTTNMLDELFNQSTDTDKNDSNKERINRWKTGMDMFILNPAFGIGMGTYPDKYLDIQTSGTEDIDENYLTENRMNLHNIFLAWLVEGGLITFISGAGLIVIFFIWLIKDLRKGKFIYLKIFLMLFMISFIFHGLVHDFTQNARIIIPFWVCLAIVSRQMSQEKARKQLSDSQL
jgi:putative inorganic carbon (hco3(-)) transporter